ncbi:hypothetical protein [Peptoniphilus sp. oral taxon 386]|uniref:hypothetical protein n=1 Tax=Peptoniphilus sp. oral taxon 386 TaxID=652713 RepID=UPI0001DAA47E|nr:hypothetical protein [Peptoniphilus sp. oral taxon 386]EFI41367.1 hypothetical protein HMPREF0629_01425 [Peptoniphilus sp. oral taxon 386 str. F0131]
MRVKKFLLFLLAVLLILTSCNNHNSSDVNNDEVEMEKEQSTAIEKEGIRYSWANMSIDNHDLNLTEEQKTVLKYFDRDYFYVYHDEYENLQRYPKAYRGAQISLGGKVIKMISSTDDKFTAILQMINTFTDYEDMDIYPSPEDNLIFIRGKQTDRRIIEGDIIDVRGRYKDVEEVTVDGKSKIIPSIDVFSHNYSAPNFIEPAELYTFEEVEKVAKIIFGNDIKMSSPDYGKLREEYGTSGLYSRFYKISLDNSVNRNFSNFNIYTTTPLILDGTFDFFADQYKEIIVAPDFEHFILLFYDMNTQKGYVEYYDKGYTKIWSKEFNNIQSLPYDATVNDFYMVADNDLYILDTSTGEEKIDPVFVGQKLKVNMLSDSCLLIGPGTKDNVMKVSKNGDIIWKASLNMNIGRAESIQIVDGNIVIDVAENTIDEKAGIAVLNKDGNILLETYKN